MKRIVRFLDWVGSLPLRFVHWVFGEPEDYTKPNPSPDTFFGDVWEFKKAWHELWMEAFVLPVGRVVQKFADRRVR